VAIAAGPAFLLPSHQVTLASFAIGKTEVTVGAYKEYVDA
jgi:formylglycine-generating enzyme required for sulfatase activity